MRNRSLAAGVPHVGGPLAADHALDAAPRSAAESAAPVTGTDAERAAYLAGYTAGARAEWQAARDQVKQILTGQARAGRELLTAALEALGLPDLTQDGMGPLYDEQDAASSWLDHVAQRSRPGA